MRIGQRLVLIILALFVVFCLLFLFANLSSFSSNAYNAFNKRANELADFTANVNALNVWNYSHGNITEFAEFLVQDESVLAVIFDFEEVGSGDDDRHRIGFDRKHGRMDSLGGPLGSVVASPNANEYTLHLRRPLVYEGRTLGEVHLYFSDAYIVAEIKRQAVTFMAWLLGFVLIYFVVVYLAANRLFLRPFKNVHNLASWVTERISHISESKIFDINAVPLRSQIDERFLVDQYRKDDMGDFVRAFLSLIDGFSVVVAEVISYSRKLQGMNDNLEMMIEARTRELAVSNTRLQESLNSLKQTQANMIQQEKLASIGQLAAGVAHEINNPIGYVASNINRLGEYFTDFQELINAYAAVVAALPDGIAKEAEASVALVRDKIDYDFLKDDVVDVLNDCREGSRRVREIVQSLKDFSRVDHMGANTEFNLNDAISTTLKLVWNELKYHCEVKQSLGSDVLVVANLGQINQVISNLLVNASHAVKATGTRGEITINTSTEGDNVVLKIGDTGCGIPEEARSKVFDPFFTTKPVGQGTGLGLNICYDIIVNKHKGELSFLSEVGKGTTFIVKLPRKLPTLLASDVAAAMNNSHEESSHG